MADTYVINTVFKGQDQLSSTIGAATRRMDKFGKRSERNFKRATKSASMFRSVLGGVLGASVISRGMGMLTQSVRGLNDEFLDLDHTITSAAAKFDFERGTKEFEALEKAARNVASETPFSAAQAAKGLDFLAMAGFTAEQSMSSLKGVTDLAIAGEMDLAQASDIASDALGALNLMSDDSVELATNLTRVNDVLAKVAVSANTDIPMLWEALKPVASTAEGLGGSIEELGAMFGVLAGSGIKQEKAGTALKNMYLRVTGGTAEVTKVLKKYNIALEDSDGKMRPLMDILEDVDKGTKGLSDTTRQAALTHLFGARAVNSATVLMKAGKEEVGKFQKSLEGATGASSKMARMMGESIPNKLKVMRSTMIEVGLGIIDTFKDRIPGALDEFQGKLDAIDPQEIVDNIMSVIDKVKEFSGTIEALATTYLLYKGALMAATTWQWAINTAMAANPISLMVLAFAALGTTLWMVYKDWDRVSAVMKKDILDLGRWIDEKLTQPFERLMRQFPKVAKLLGVTPRSEAEINRLYAGQAEAQQPGYILGSDKGTAAGKALADQIRAEQGIDAYKAAPLQKVQINGQFNFANPPAGMSFDQETKGAPPISHNLGQN